MRYSISMNRKQRTTLIIEATSQVELEVQLRGSCNGKCWLISVCFGRAYATGYDRASEFPVDAPSDAGWLPGYWKSGQWMPFSTKAQRRYQNSAIGHE